MKCQSLFPEKNKKNILNLSSAKYAQRVVTVNHDMANISLSKRGIHINPVYSKYWDTLTSCWPQCSNGCVSD